MNDYNRQHQLSQERHVLEPIRNRDVTVIQSVYKGRSILAAMTFEEEHAVRKMYEPKVQVGPALSNIVELPQREYSLPADNRPRVPVMPLPEQPASVGEIIDMDQYRMAQDARDQLNAA